MLKRTGPNHGEAKLRYLDADFQIVQMGDHVVCAVTGAKISLEDLKYWSVDTQEAYVDANAAFQRWTELNKKASA